VPVNGLRIEVCHATFLACFGVKKVLVASIRKSCSLDFVQKSENKGRKRIHADSVKRQLKRIPRQSSHYAPYRDQQAGTERILPSDLTYTKCWRLWCEENDPEFYEQAVRVKFWRSLDRKQQWPVPGKLLHEGESVLKPKLAHSTYYLHFTKYNLRFGAARVDTCETCDGFINKVKAFANQECHECLKTKRQHAEHTIRADKGYKHQQFHIEEARITFPIGFDFDAVKDFRQISGCEFQCQDAGGNFRTPRGTQGECFYLRILSTYTYSIYSAAHNQHSLYFWNETIGEKGVNNVISAEYDHHMKQGSGAQHLRVWFDACAGQCANWTLVMFHCYITDPDLGSCMYDRLDSLTPQKGHTYMENDRGFSTVVRESNNGEWKTICDLDDWMTIASRANRARPHRLVKFEQSMHYDWVKFLSQLYVKGRKDIEGVKALLVGAMWRSYGASEELVIQPDGSSRVELVEHPGEVWIRYSHDDTEPWTKVDMRRWSKRSTQGRYYRDDDGMTVNIGTGELNATDFEEDHTKYPLYDSPRPVAAKKKRDLLKHCTFLPEDRRAQYEELKVSGQISDSGSDKDDMVEDESDSSD
jgi:hypothetical protein